MIDQNFPFQRIAVAAHPQLPAARAEADIIGAYLTERGCTATTGFIYESMLVSGVQNGDYDLWIALGGDGTLLRSGHLCAPFMLPVLGINMGNVGFLMEVQQEDWRRYLDLLIAGEYWIENRMMLRAEQYRDDVLLGGWDVVNEAMVGRGEIMRPVKLITYVDGHYLTTTVADGLIAATPTGSTAYALAAGGPVLPPNLRNILLVPVAPHLSFDRAIVLAEGSMVSININTDHKAALSVDGQNPVVLEDGDRVDVALNQHQLLFVRFEKPGYYYRNLTSRMNMHATNNLDIR